MSKECTPVRCPTPRAAHGQKAGTTLALVKRSATEPAQSSATTQWQERRAPPPRTRSMFASAIPHRRTLGSVPIEQMRCTCRPRGSPVMSVPQTHNQSDSVLAEGPCEHCLLFVVLVLFLIHRRPATARRPEWFQSHLDTRYCC